MYDSLKVIVFAVIEEGGKVLLGKKEEGEHPVNIGGEWTLPGGAVGKGESLEDALKREMREEISADIEVLGPIGASVDETTRKHKNQLVLLVSFKARLLGKPRAGSDLTELKFVDKENLTEELGQNFKKNTSAKLWQE